MKENSTGTKHKWKTCRVWPREKRKDKKAAKQNRLSIWKEMYEEPYTHEDGHVGRNM
jgi:hypothetical protein